MKKLFCAIILFSAIFPSCNRYKNDGWVSLFNGKDLTGWKQLSGRNGNAKYEVINGEIVGTTVEDTPNSFLVTEKTYSDFVFELDLFLEEPMNSGIQFRSLSTPDYKQGRVHGYQCEVDPSSRAWSGGIYDEARRGWLYPMTLNPEGGKSFKLNDWNHYRIECIGSTIRTWLNGVPAAYLVDDLTSEGFIALQIHSVGEGKGGRHIKWKNIRIKTENLEATVETNSIFVMNSARGDLSAGEKSNGWEWLWDGKSGESWKTMVPGLSFEDRWRFEDGALTILSMEEQAPSKLLDISFDVPYNYFDIQWKFMHAEGSESGLSYFSDPSSGFPGLEFQLQDDRTTGDTVAVHSLASLYGIKAAALRSRFVRPAGEWNLARLVVSPDKKVEHWVNGIKALEYSLDDEDIKNILPKSKLLRNILLKDEGKEVSFRDFKIRSLE